MKKLTAMLVLLAMFPMMTGCGPMGVETQQVSNSGANQVRIFSEIKKNSKGNTVEQQNILDRVDITTDPTKVMWIHLIALDGKIIRRMPVRSKITSSGKRLEPKHAANTHDYFPDSPFLIPGRGNTYWETDEFIQADGTYGDSDDYVYWFDPMGRYHQWGTAGGLGYLKTDYPIDLVNPSDRITGLYNMDKAAHNWQDAQEQKLREAEGVGKTLERHIEIPQSKPEVSQ